jgi:membrane associated rhomboid family serine protease
VEVLSAAIGLSMLVPLLVPVARKRHACLLTVVWNFVIFILMYVASLAGGAWLYGAVEVDLGLDTARMADPSQLYRLFSAMYVHAGALHILMNMIILTLMGVPFEDRIGTRKWMALYISTGFAGNIVDVLFAMFTGNHHLGIGASGAIFGVMGAFAMLYPRDEIPMMLGFVFLQKVPVFAAVVVMALLETIYMAVAAQDNVGHLVHMASLIVGVALAIPVSGGRHRAGGGKNQHSDAGMEALRVLGTTPETRGLVDKIIGEDVPEVRKAWLDELEKKAKCPRCMKPLAHVSGKYFCACGFKVHYPRQDGGL